MFDCCGGEETTIDSTTNITTAMLSSSTTTTTPGTHDDVDQDANTDVPTITLRITGLGHTLTLEHISTHTTIGQLKQQIENETNVPIPYQRLLARGHKFDDDSNDNLTTLDDINMKDRTKIILLHNHVYALEKDGYTKLMMLEKEINNLIDKHNTESLSKIVLEELVTRICCKLDMVEINGSEHLRSIRKRLLNNVNDIEKI